MSKADKKAAKQQVQETEATAAEKAGAASKQMKRAIVYLAKESPGIFPLALLQAVMEAAYPYIGILLSAGILTELADPGRSMSHLFRMALLLVGL